MLVEDGFNAVDYSELCEVTGPLYEKSEKWMEETLAYEKKVLDGHGISISQIHGPWRYPPMDGSAFERNQWLMLMQRSVRAAALLGSPCVVVHPLMPFGANSAQNPGFVIDCNAEHYARLCDYAKDYGVTVCLENMPFPLLPLAHVEQVCDFVDALGRKNLKVCLDTGTPTFAKCARRMRCVFWAIASRRFIFTTTTARPTIIFRRLRAILILPHSAPRCTKSALTDRFPRRQKA